MYSKVIWKIYEIQNRFDDNVNKPLILWQHKICFLYQKFKFVVSQNEIKWYLWYQKVDFVISQNRICDIAKLLWLQISDIDFYDISNWYCDITNLYLFCISTDQVNFVILQIKILFAISHIKLKFCDITISLLKWMLFGDVTNSNFRYH